LRGQVLESLMLVVGIDHLGASPTLKGSGRQWRMSRRPSGY